jgi:serine/threonine protein kinase
VQETPTVGLESNNSDNSGNVLLFVIILPAIFTVIFTCVVVACIWKRTARVQISHPISSSKTALPDGGLSTLRAKYKQWEFSREQIQLLSKLGDGYFGTVWRAQAYGIIYPVAWTTVAVKTGKSDDLNNTSEGTTACPTSLCEEAKLLTDMGCCDNKNVVRLLGLCYRGGPMWLIFEHAQHGNLRCYLRSKRGLVLRDQQPASALSSLKTTEEDGSVITPWKMFNFALQVANGMKYLISRKVVHCDLAARNVLVFEDEILKICDFGMAKDIRYVDYYRREMPCVVPAKWMSPESMLDKIHTEFSDVWSFGILMWEIATLGGSPYPGVPVEKLYDLLIKGYRMSCPASCPRSLYEEMKVCWAAQPEDRPKFESLSTRISHKMTEIEV